MKPDTLAILCNSTGLGDLEIKTEADAQGHIREFLADLKTGQRFPIREGIPVFIPDGSITGSNLRYQAMYDRFAPFYDFSTWAYSIWKGMSV